MVAKIGQKCYYCYLKVKKVVEVVLPLKQGLKLFLPRPQLPWAVFVEVVLPLKQGLKPETIAPGDYVKVGLKWFFH